MPNYQLALVDFTAFHDVSCLLNLNLIYLFFQCVYSFFLPWLGFSLVEASSTYLPVYDMSLTQIPVLLAKELRNWKDAFKGR